MYTHVRHIRQHNPMQKLQQKNATSISKQERLQSQSSQMRNLQKPYHPPTRFKRIRRFPKPQEEKLQSKTKIRRKLIRSIHPKRNHRLHARTRKPNERDGQLVHGRLQKTISKFLTWQK